MRWLSALALILVLIGALNWGLWGFFQFDFIAWLFNGNTTWLSRLIYALIGLSGVWSLRKLLYYSYKCCCKECGCKCACCKDGSCCTK